MGKNKSSTFFTGFVIGTLIVMLVWYWQKSTSAEDGALDLLDRYAESQARLRKLESNGDAASSVAGSSSRMSETAGGKDDLQAIVGIGPTYAQRFASHGITSYAQLAALSPDKAREMVGVSMKRTAEVAEWIADARRLAAI